MIKQGIKNYFICLKHFFTPIGTLFLGIVLGLSVFISGLAPAFTNVVNEVNRFSTDIAVDPEKLADSIFRAVGELNWREPSAALSTMLSQEWLGKTLTDCINSFIGVDYETYLAAVTKVVEEFVATFVVLLVMFFLCVLLGMIGGHFLTKFLVRRTIAKRAWWKYFLIALIDSALSATLIALCIYFINLWSPSILITSWLSLILFGAVALLEAYFAHGVKKVKFVKIFNPKNILGLIATNLIVFVIAVAFTSLAGAIVNSAIGAIVGFSLLEIALLSSSMHAESYVLQTIEAQNENANGKQAQTE